MGESIDILEAQLKNASTIKEKIDALNELAWTIRREQPAKAMEMSLEAFVLSQESTPSYEYGTVASLITQAGIHVYEPDFGKTLAKSFEALPIAENDPELINLMPRLLYNVAVAYGQLGNPSEALNYGFRQLQISEELNDIEGIATASLVIGFQYYESGDLEKTLIYQEKSLAAFEKLDQPYWLIIGNNNLSEINRNMGNVEKGIEYAKLSLKISQEREVPMRGKQLAHIAMGESYMELGDFTNALSYMEQAYALAQESSEANTESEILLSIGVLYNRMGKPEEAINYLTPALELAKSIQMKHIIYECNRVLATSYEKTGNFKEAFYCYQEYHTLRESAVNDQSNQTLQNLEVLYQTENAQKEAEYYSTLYQSEQSRGQLQETLNQVGQALNSTLDLTEVLEEILKQFEHLVQFDRGALLLWAGDKLEFVAARGYSEETNPLQMIVPINTEDTKDVFVRIHNDKKPFALDNAAEYDGWKTGSTVSVPGSWLGVPLIRNDEVTGMLSLARESIDPYTEDSISLAVTFAAQAAIALENATLYDQVHRFNQQLEEEVRIRTEDVREAYERLERLDRTKSDFIGITAHELRTPITVLKGYGQMLEKDAAIQSNPYHKSLVEGMVTGAMRLHEVVNTMLMMLKIDSRQLEIYAEPLNIYQVISNVTINLDDVFKDRKQTVIVDEAIRQLPDVEGDKDALLTVFNHIIINAVKYTPDGGRITIKGNSWTDTPPKPDLPHNAIELIVTDTGIGIDPAAHELIFNKFYQTADVSTHSSGKTKFKGGGAGLGLAIARGIVEAHKGKLWVHSTGHDEENLPGSDFHIVIPVRQPKE